jgi:DNA-binding response OmpR family regulator
MRIVNGKAYAHGVDQANDSKHSHPLVVGPASQSATAGFYTREKDSKPLRVAHIDRDSGLLMVTAKRLERRGHEHRVLSLALSTDRIAALQIDALIIDIAVLGPRRWEWLKSLCGLKRSFGIVVCTSSSTVAERVRALRLGVDDWLAKPCHPEELLARVEVVVRSGRHTKGQGRHEAKPITAGELEVRRNQCQAFVAGESLELTPREFQLLELLACHDRCVLEREYIYERLWGYLMLHGDRSVDVFVHKVRTKLESASPEWCYIHTHFGVGYRFTAEPLGCEMPQEQRLAA